jgi:PiT family inorganic phosphate transporter
LSDAVQSIGLPAIPLVPVSSSQVVIGSIIGIGMYKGGKQIKYSILGSISLGWIATPIAACILSFFMLFFVNNVFKQDVGGINDLIPKTTQTVELNDSLKIIDEKPVISDSNNNNSANFNNLKSNSITDYKTHIMWILVLTLVLIISLLAFLLMRQKRKIHKIKAEENDKETDLANQLESLKKRLTERINQQTNLGKELKFKQSEMITMAMSIIHKNEFLDNLKVEILKIKGKVSDHETRLGLNKLSLMITQDLSIDRDRERFQLLINEQGSKFNQLLSESFPSLTENEKRLISLLRLNLSSKEIASILNISPKSVEMNRYRLRKKLKVDPKINLNDFIRDF